MTYFPRQAEIDRYIFYDKATIDRLLKAQFYPITIWFYEIDIPDDAVVRVNAKHYPLEYISDNVVIYGSYAFTYKPDEPNSSHITEQQQVPFAPTEKVILQNET